MSAPAFCGLHAATARTWSSETYPLPACRRAFSRRIRMEKGRAESFTSPASSRTDGS